jgi:hypothetical protein
MAHPTYLRKVLATGKIQRIPFTAEHYKTAGVLPAMLSGLPVLEAYQTVNRLNVSQHDQQYVYALED